MVHHGSEARDKVSRAGRSCSRSKLAEKDKVQSHSVFSVKGPVSKIKKEDYLAFVSRAPAGRLPLKMAAQIGNLIGAGALLYVCY